MRCGGVALDPLVLVVMGWSCVTRCALFDPLLVRRGAGACACCAFVRAACVRFGARADFRLVVLLANWQIYGVYRGLVAPFWRSDRRPGAGRRGGGPIETVLAENPSMSVR